MLSITSILLFSSEVLLQKLGLLVFRDAVKTWVGVVWILSISILLAGVAKSVYASIKVKTSDKKQLKVLEKRLHSLSVGEKEFLSHYINNNSKTQSADISDGIAMGLEVAKVVFRASSISEYNTSFAFNIQPWAWEYLHKHPEYLHKNA